MNIVELSYAIDVRKCGALGNKIADDTVAIQAAIDSVGAHGGAVFFPPGTYRVTAPLIISAHCTTLCGSTMGQNGNIGTEIIGSTDHDIIRVDGGVDFFAVKTLAICHIPRAPHTIPSVVLNITKSNNVLIRDCMFRNIWNGILIDGCSQVTIENIEVRDTKAISGTSYGLCLTNEIGPTLGVHLTGGRFFGRNNTPGASAVLGRGSGTVHMSKMAITKWAQAMKLEQGPIDPDACAFWHISSIETENCDNGFWIDGATRFYANDCQAALSKGYGWRLGSTNIGQASLTSCVAVNNGEHGYHIDNAGTDGSFVLTGCIAGGNSQSVPRTFSGLAIESSDNVTITGGRYGGGGSGLIPGVVKQLNGILVLGAATKGISVVGANLEGNVVPLSSEATVAPLVVGCRGYEEGAQQVGGSILPPPRRR